MGSRNRNSTEQRDNFLLETNFDDDGALTRAHFDNNRISNNGGTAETRPRAYRSNYSIDRYSDAAKSYREGQSKVILSEQMHKNILCLLIKKHQTHWKWQSDSGNCCCCKLVCHSKSMLNHTHFDIIFVLCVFFSIHELLLVSLAVLQDHTIKLLLDCF